MASNDSRLLFVQVPGTYNIISDGRQVENRAARSHAIKAGLKKRRDVERKSGGNFRVITERKQKRVVGDSLNDEVRSRRCGRDQGCSVTRTVARGQPETPTSQAGLRAQLHVDPFEVLAGDARELDKWVRNHSGKSSSEPIFTVADELVLHNFRRLFKEIPDDDALRSATMLTVSFAAAGLMDRRSLEHQSRALRVISSRVSRGPSYDDDKSFEATVAAILLLAGIEARLSIPNHVQLHLNAVKQLLCTRPDRLSSLTDATKRAIFWQDLNSCVMAGSMRVVNHTTFTELQWERSISSATSSNHFTLQGGFVEVSHLLTNEFVEILKDVHAFQLIRDSELFPAMPKPDTTQIDNHQASIQSRLMTEETMAGTKSKDSTLQQCLGIATYLCCTMLRCRLWTTSGAPSYLSSKLLDILQYTSADPVWIQHPEILIWLLIIGGVFSPKDSKLRSDFRETLEQLGKVRKSRGANCRIRFEIFHDWPMTREFLRQYIWSESAYLDLARDFWEELRM